MQLKSTLSSFTFITLTPKSSKVYSVKMYLTFMYFHGWEGGDGWVGGREVGGMEVGGLDGWQEPHLFPVDVSKNVFVLYFYTLQRKQIIRNRHCFFQINQLPF